MNLDVIVPTYNRSQLLKLTVASLLKADIPAGLAVTIIIVDNNCKDDTEQVVRQIQATATRPIVYVKETKQGLSNARNGGIDAGHGDLSRSSTTMKRSTSTRTRSSPASLPPPRPSSSAAPIFPTGRLPSQTGFLLATMR